MAAILPRDDQRFGTLTGRRAILVMRELEGLDARGIASSLGLSRITVRWHLALARRAMASTLTATKEYTMAFDSDRLREGDPLREGMRPLDEARSQMREAVLAVVAGEPPRSPRRKSPQSPLRLVIVAVVVLVVVLAWTGARVW